MADVDTEIIGAIERALDISTFYNWLKAKRFITFPPGNNKIHCSSCNKAIAILEPVSINKTVDEAKLHMFRYHGEIVTTYILAGGRL